MTEAQSTRARIATTLKLRPALELIWRCSKGWSVATAAITLVQSLVPLVTLYLLKLIVDALEAGLTDRDAGFDFTPVAVLIAAAGAVALISAGLQSAAGFVGEAQAEVLTDYMHDLLHAKSTEVDLEYYENSQYHDTLHLAQEQAPHRPRLILNGMVQVVRNGISLLAVAGLLFLFHWSIPAILLAASLPGLMVRLRYADTLYSWHRERAPASRLARFFDRVLTRDFYAKEVRLFELAELFRGKYRELRRKLRRERMRIAARRSFADLLAHGSGILAVFGSLSFIAYRSLQGEISLGDLVMYFQAFQRGQAFLREMLHGLADLYANNLFLDAFREFLSLEPRVVDPEQPEPVPRPMRHGIEFDGVSFRYPRAARQALEDIDLTIRPGETVALVGENGAGKTTLVKLLCRLYEPSAGSISIDGIDLRKMRASDLRREISAVFQDYAGYYMTARENIWLGDVRLPPEHERVAAAARLAGVDGVITDLPEGYETILGKWFKHGEELSIGEWQKVALARAFLRDAPITILDEPTSALDAQTEAEIIDRLRDLAGGRTAILISHRLSTVRMADRIYVMAGGRIVESGSHDDLMRRGEAYARLFSFQARYYQDVPEVGQGTGASRLTDAVKDKPPVPTGE